MLTIGDFNSFFWFFGTPCISDFHSVHFSGPSGAIILLDHSNSNNSYSIASAFCGTPWPVCIKYARSCRSFMIMVCIPKDLKVFEKTELGHIDYLLKYG